MADGHIYGFPYLVTAAPSRISAKYFMNEKWLEAVSYTHLPEREFQLLDRLGLSDSVKEKILYRNGAELLKIPARK